MFWDILIFGPWSVLILLPGIFLGIYAQVKVSTTYSRYSRVYSQSGISAAMMAKEMMVKAGIYDVGIKPIKGNLTDNYNPATDIVSLSQTTYNSTSIAALGVAAHEIGHVMQQKEGYFPMKLRSVLVPAVNFGTRAFMPLLIIGILIEWIGSESSVYFANFVINLSIILYGLSTLFAFITLPVEFNASRRAKKNLVEYGILTKEECRGASQVLDAAALTYIASFLTSLLYFLRFLIIIGGFRRRDK